MNRVVRKRVYVRVSGFVQGVGFRYFTQRKARELQLVGFVRNLADGSVEMGVEGEHEHVETLVQAVRRGPAGSRVLDFFSDEQALSGSGEDFDIKV